MANDHPTDWTAKTVAQFVLISGKSKHQVATEAAIPYATFNRKLRGGSDFNWGELLRLAEVLNVRPSKFTPPQFQDKAAS